MKDTDGNFSVWHRKTTELGFCGSISTDFKNVILDELLLSVIMVSKAAFRGSAHLVAWQ